MNRWNRKNLIQENRLRLEEKEVTYIKNNRKEPTGQVVEFNKIISNI